MRYPDDLSYARLSFVRSDLDREYDLIARICEKCLKINCYNDISDTAYVFDEQTTAKFETRFQSLGNSEQFLWKLKETYVREGDKANEALARILAYCERKGMVYTKSSFVSFDGRE